MSQVSAEDRERAALPSSLRIDAAAALTNALIIFVALLVLMPILFLVIGGLSTKSFGQPGNRLVLENFRIVYTTGKYLGALGNTFWLAFLVTLVSVSVGGLLAFFIARSDMPGRRTLEFFIIAPVFISPLLGAMAWMALGSPRAGLLNVWIGRPLGLQSPLINIISFEGIVFVMSLFFIPYAYLFLIGPLRNMDSELEEASRMSGASLPYTLATVTLPLLGPAILSTGLMVFVLSSEVFVVPRLIGASFSFQTLPTIIYDSFDYGFVPTGEAAALATLLFWLTAAGIYLYQRLTRISRRFVTISGKGSRPRIIELGGWRYAALVFTLLYLLLAVLLPFFTLLLGSFLKFMTAYLKPQIFTIQNYQQLISVSQNQLAIRNTLFLAIFGATLGVLLAVIISTVVLRTTVRGRGLLDYLAVLPISVPAIALAIGMLNAYNFVPLGIYGTIWILIMAYVTRFLGHGVRSTSSGVLQVSPELQEAARTTGASPSRTFWTITLPLIRPSLLAAWTLLFAFMVIEVSSTIFLYTTNTVTVSVVMWNAMQMGGTIRAYALAIVQTLLVFTILTLTYRFTGRMGIGIE